MSDDRLDQIEAAMRFLTVLRAGRPSQHMMDNLAEQERDLWSEHGPHLVEQVRELQAENKRLREKWHAINECYDDAVEKGTAYYEQVRQRDEVIERVQVLAEDRKRRRFITVQVVDVLAALDGPR